MAEEKDVQEINEQLNHYSLAPVVAGLVEAGDKSTALKVAIEHAVKTRGKYLRPYLEDAGFEGGLGTQIATDTKEYSDLLQKLNVGQALERVARITGYNNFCPELTEYASKPLSEFLNPIEEFAKAKKQYLLTAEDEDPTKRNEASATMRKYGRLVNVYNSVMQLNSISNETLVQPLMNQVLMDKLQEPLKLKKKEE